MEFLNVLVGGLNEDGLFWSRVNSGILMKWIEEDEIRMKPSP